jgi:secreted Zn-dependent insulinase-like peptidase
LEHMLFVSSTKYPELHSYQDFVSRQSGMTNA